MLIGASLFSSFSSFSLCFYFFFVSQWVISTCLTRDFFLFIISVSLTYVCVCVCLCRYIVFLVILLSHSVAFAVFKGGFLFELPMKGGGGGTDFGAEYNCPSLLLYLRVGHTDALMSVCISNQTMITIYLFTSSFTRSCAFFFIWPRFISLLSQCPFPFEGRRKPISSCGVSDVRRPTTASETEQK